MRGNPRFTVSAIEAESSGQRRNYTFDTLTALKQSCPGVSFSLICGSDIQHQKWYRFEGIMELVEALYVVYRPGDDAASMADAVRANVGGNEALFAKYHWIQTDGIAISSTMIRNLVCSGRSLRYLLPDAVADYIYSQGLYKPS